MKKYIILVFQIAIFLVWLYFIYFNIQNRIVVNLGTESIEISISLLVSIMYFMGFLTGIAQVFISKIGYRSQIEFYARKNEKLAQQNEIDLDDKETLERKIAALEIALKNALKK